MPIIITSILTWFGSFGAKFLTDSLLKFAAFKALAIVLITITFPIVVKNLLTWLFNVLTSFVDDLDTEGLESVAIQLTGLAAYMAQHLQLVDCLAIILTAVAIRFTLNLIPFIG